MTATTPCGAPTRRGGACRNRVKANGFCAAGHRTGPPANQTDAASANSGGATADPMATPAGPPADLQPAGTLYINQGGRITCTTHGGGYLQAAAGRQVYVDGDHITTSLDDWEVFSPEVVAEHGLVCETCAQGGRR